MDLFKNIIVDLLVLCFFGLLYYFYGKKKIINSLESLDQEFKWQLDQIIVSIHEFLDANKNLTSFKEINDFVTKLEDRIHQSHTDFPKDLVSPNDLPDEIKQQLNDLSHFLKQITS